MGRGRGGPAEIFPLFYFCAQQLWDMRGVLVDLGQPKASPVNVYGRGGEGLLANMQASGPLIMILHIDMWHIKGTHSRAIIIIIYFTIRD